MAWLNIYQNLKHLIQDAITPEIQGLKGDIKAPSERIDSLDKHLDARIDSLEKRMEEKFAAVEGKFAAVEKRLHLIDRRLDLTIDVRERLAAVEARLQQR